MEDVSLGFTQAPRPKQAPPHLHTSTPPHLQMPMRSDASVGDLIDLGSPASASSFSGGGGSGIPTAFSVLPVSKSPSMVMGLKLSRTIYPPIDSIVSSFKCAMDPDGTLAVAACPAGCVSTWNTSTGALLSTIEVSAAGGMRGSEVTAVCFSGNGGQVGGYMDELCHDADAFIQSFFPSMLHEFPVPPSPLCLYHHSINCPSLTAVCPPSIC